MKKFSLKCSVFNKNCFLNLRLIYLGLFSKSFLFINQVSSFFVILNRIELKTLFRYKILKILLNLIKHLKKFFNQNRPRLLKPPLLRLLPPPPFLPPLLPLRPPPPPHSKLGGAENTGKEKLTFIVSIYDFKPPAIAKMMKHKRINFMTASDENFVTYQSIWSLKFLLS